MNKNDLNTKYKINERGKDVRSKCHNKVQNELAKKAIILALKDWSNDLFQNNGLMFRCFVDRTENQVEIFHVFRTKEEVEKVRKNKSEKFWNQIKEMGGQVTRFEGNCEVEVSKGLQDLDLEFK